MSEMYNQIEMSFPTIFACDIKLLVMLVAHIKCLRWLKTTYGWFKNSCTILDEHTRQDQQQSFAIYERADALKFEIMFEIVHTIAWSNTHGFVNLVWYKGGSSTLTYSRVGISCLSRVKHG
jgi:hypothetical protein